MLPSAFMALDFQEKAFIIACIDTKVEAEQKEIRKYKRKGG